MVTLDKYQDLISKAVEQGTYSFGLRVMTGMQSDNVNVGDMIASSFDWIDGVQSDVELGGASVIGFETCQIDGEIDEESWNNAIKLIAIYGEDVVLVGGHLDINAIFNDAGECILSNAVVLAKFTNTAT